MMKTRTQTKNLYTFPMMHSMYNQCLHSSTFVVYHAAKSKHLTTPQIISTYVTLPGGASTPLPSAGWPDCCQGRRATYPLAEIPDLWTILYGFRIPLPASYTSGPWRQQGSCTTLGSCCHVTVMEIVASDDMSHSVKFSKLYILFILHLYPKTLYSFNLYRFLAFTHTTLSAALFLDLLPWGKSGARWYHVRMLWWWWDVYRSTHTHTYCYIQLPAYPKLSHITFIVCIITEDIWAIPRNTTLDSKQPRRIV